jgi:hypothetical protein
MVLPSGFYVFVSSFPLYPVFEAIFIPSFQVFSGQMYPFFQSTPEDVVTQGVW